jgi:hypothetical protein
MSNDFELCQLKHNITLILKLVNYFSKPIFQSSIFLQQQKTRGVYPLHHLLKRHDNKRPDSFSNVLTVSQKLELTWKY